METTIHKVNKINVTKTEFFCTENGLEFFTRYIKIKTERGEILTISLVSDKFKDLEILEEK